MKRALYKTRICESWELNDCCEYGDLCQYAHGKDELMKKGEYLRKKELKKKEKIEKIRRTQILNKMNRKQNNEDSADYDYYWGIILYILAKDSQFYSPICMSSSYV